MNMEMNANMKLEKGVNENESRNTAHDSAHDAEKKFQQELAATLVGKWPETRNEIDEFNRDTFYNNAIAALQGADADIQAQFIEDMKVVKYEDMEELFKNYVTFAQNRRARAGAHADTLTGTLADTMPIEENSAEEKAA